MRNVLASVQCLYSILNYTLSSDDHLWLRDLLDFEFNSPLDIIVSNFMIEIILDLNLFTFLGIRSTKFLIKKANNETERWKTWIESKNCN